MYTYFKAPSDQPPFEAPFNKRVGLPWLAAQLPLDETTAFKSINVAAGIVAAFFTFLILRGRFRPAVITACMIPLACYVFSPLRFPNFCPFVVDPAAMMFYAIAIFWLSRGWPILAAVLLATSTLFRETGFYLTAALALSIWLSDRRMRRTALTIGLMAVASLALSNLVALPGGPYSQLRVFLWCVREKFLDPLEFLRVAMCFMATLAPFLLCAAPKRLLFRGETDLATVASRNFLFICLAMAAFGGTDTTRLLFIGYPLYVLALAGWSRDADVRTIVLTALVGMAANRFCLIIPLPTSPTPGEDSSGLFDTTPDYAQPGVVVAFAAYWLACWLLVAGPGRLLLERLMGPPTPKDG
jgi:hypothetical protein